MTIFSVDEKIKMNEQSSYYALQIPFTSRSAIAGKQPQSQDDWLLGKKITESITKPLSYNFSPGKLHAYYPLKIPLMSDELLIFLKEQGVDNIESFEAVIYMDGSGEIVNGYKAVNVLGRVSASVEEEGALGADIGFPMPSTGLVIDEASHKGLFLFRVDGRDDIIVCESLKVELEELFDDFGFMFL